MCIAILNQNHKLEFDPKQPLVDQVEGAKEILINYDPCDPKIDSFMDQLQAMVKNGIDFKINIKVNTNNCLEGVVMERQIESLRQKLEVNNLIKSLSFLHEDTDKKLKEISQICFEINNDLEELNVN